MKKKNKIPKTYEENPRFWENQGKRKFVRLLYFLDTKRRCLMCKYNLREAPVKKYNKNKGILDMFSSEFLFHLKQTHGIDPDVFESMLISEDQG